MEITKVERKELDILSKDVFGSSSRWQKLIGKGYDDPVTEEIEETVPSEKEGEEPTKRTVRVTVKANGSDKSVKYVRKYHTIETVLAFMVEQKKQLDVLRAAMAKQKAEFLAKMEAEKAAEKAKKDAEEVAKQVHTSLSGSAKL